MKNGFALGLLLLLSLQILAQGVTMETYLGTALRDQSLERYRAQLDFLDNNKYNSPWINRVEFRIGSEDANISMNEYRLRVSPSNPGEIKANKIYYNKHIQNIGTQYKVALNEALKNRYQMLINYSFLVDAVKRSEQNLALLNELARNLSLLGMENIDAGVIVNIQSDQTEIMLRLEELKNEKAEIEYYIGLDLPSYPLSGLESQVLITVDEIKLFLDNKEKETDWTSLYVLEAEEDIHLKEQMLKIDKAQARSNIGYVQGNFDTQQGNELDEHFGFQLGVRIPIVNPDKPDLNRKRVDLIEDQKSLDATKDFVNQKKEMTILRINQRINQYRILNERIELSNSISISNGKNFDLSDLTKVKKYQFSLERDKSSIEREIRELYIEYIDIKGSLAQDPLINYLSKEFNKIE